MKIVSANVNFKSGLTSRMKSEIASSDVKKISSALLKDGISSDFKGNKIIAWCCAKTIEIIKVLNELYKLNLTYPKEIYVEDFNLLKTENKNAVGLTNFVPTKLFAGGNKIIPEKTIIFNEYKDADYMGGNNFWDCIDSFSDANFDCGQAATNFFLEPFFHEFSHIMHGGSMIKNIGRVTLAERIQNYLDPYNAKLFRDKYSTLLHPICSNASKKPLEAVASDLSKRMTENINRDTLFPVNNLFSMSPYEKIGLAKYIKVRNDKLYKMLHGIWKGKPVSCYV